MSEKPVRGQKIVICNSCGSNKIKLVGNIYYMIGLICIAIIPGLIWIPILGWALIPVCLILSIVLLIIGSISKKSRVTCTECKNGFNISKEKYKRLKKLLK